MTTNKFVGSWSLVSSSFKREDGSVTYPLGEKVLGRINYEANGTMAAQLYSTTRPKFATEDPSQGTNDDIRSAFIGMICYFGQYHIDEEKQRITHQVEGCSFPNWIESRQVRFYSFLDDKLILRTPPMQFGNGVQIGELVWQRIGGATS